MSNHSQPGNDHSEPFANKEGLSVQCAQHEDRGEDMSSAPGVQGDGQRPQEHDGHNRPDGLPSHFTSQTANEAQNSGPPRNGHLPSYGNIPNRIPDSSNDPDAGFKSRMITIFHREGEPWSLFKAAKLVILQNNIVRTFSENRKAYQHICEVCRKLELHQSKFIVSQHSSDRREQAFSQLLATERQQHGGTGGFSSGYSRLSLGQLRCIKERSTRCPFCKLVVHSLKESISAERHKANITSREEAVKRYGDDKRHLMKNIKKTEEEMEILTKESRESAVARYEDQEREYKETIDRATCFVSFQMDGREVFRDESGNVVRSSPRTRRIQLHWSHNDLKDAYIVLVAPEFGRGYNADQQDLWESNALFLARNIGSANKNDARIRRWVDLCREHHGKACNSEPGPDFSRLISKAFFGVIDVAEMRLTSLPVGSRYVALSYTWGSHTLYTTNISNIRLHQEHGGLEKVFALLPKVIRDAIQLVRSLRERYLWVDSLCIVQNNDISWSLNSSVMDLVYGNAYVTICAAEGEGAQMGLRASIPNARYLKLSKNVPKVLDSQCLTWQRRISRNRNGTREGGLFRRGSSLVDASYSLEIEHSSNAVRLHFQRILMESKKLPVGRSSWFKHRCKSLSIYKVKHSLCSWNASACIQSETWGSEKTSWQHFGAYQIFSDGKWVRLCTSVFQRLTLTWLCCGSRFQLASEEYLGMLKNKMNMAPSPSQAGHGVDGLILPLNIALSPFPDV